MKTSSKPYLKKSRLISWIQTKKKSFSLSIISFCPTTQIHKKVEDLLVFHWNNIHPNVSNTCLTYSLWTINKTTSDILNVTFRNFWPWEVKYSTNSSMSVAKSSSSACKASSKKIQSIFRNQVNISIKQTLWILFRLRYKRILEAWLPSYVAVLEKEGWLRIKKIWWVSLH